MKTLPFIVLICGLLSCSLAPRHDSTKTHAARSAHYGKYIVEQSRSAGSRHLFTSPDGKRCLNSSKAVSEYLSYYHPERNRDAAFILILNPKNQVVSMDQLEPEALTSMPTYIPEIKQKVTDIDAAAVILVQCLTTRSAHPYQNDREISKLLKSALEEVEISFLDHVLIGRAECFSFADNHIL